jgi:predicted amidohydrolase YtcJ
VDANYGMFADNRIGKLKKGHLDDLVILDKDILTMNDIRGTKVMYTIVGRKFVYIHVIQVE